MFNKILVAYDGSTCSKESLATATEFLQKEAEAELHVIHVIDALPANIYGLYGAALTNKVIDEFEEVGNELLTEAQGLTADYKQACTYARLSGNVAEEIVKYAKVKEIDLIIIGSRGLGAVKGMLMGSVSSRVVQQADCHVLTIK